MPDRIRSSDRLHRCYSTIMQKIVPHLWFDKEAKEAAKFYVSAFGGSTSSPQADGSKITHISTLHDTPSGDCDIVSFDLCGYSFMAISAGPIFTLNPCISFMLNFDPSTDNDARKHLDALWEKLSDGGTPRMAIDKYPFSDRYGWIEDKYGVNWQLILTKPDGEPRPFIMPSLMFTGDITGKAGEAMDFYVSVFKDAKRGFTAEYPEGASPEPDAKIMFAEFMLEGQWFTAMDSGHMHKFAFNEAISLLVCCKDQKEIDYYSDKLSADPAAEQCGWLKDKYGLSWQVSPIAMEEMLASDQEAVDRVMEAFMPMKRVDLAALRKAYEGK